MKTIVQIASNTFKDAIRQKLILLITLICILLVFSSNSLLALDLGNQKLKFIFDFSNGALNLFGGIIAVVSICQLFHTELENKTVITLLSKPVSRTSFILAKLLGNSYILFLFTVSIIFCTIIMLHQTNMGLPQKMYINYAGIMVYGLAQFVKLVMISSIAILVCTLSSSLIFSIIISFLIITASMIGAITIFMGSKLEGLSKIASNIMPDLQIFNSLDSIIFAEISTSNVLAVLSYGLIYIALCLLLAVIFFKNKEL